jgi:hypothetical protein
VFDLATSADSTSPSPESARFVPLCRHCAQRSATRSRRLCWACFSNPEVRRLYPITSPFARRGVRDFFGRPPLPDQPTDAQPGSEEKILVLMERAQRGQSLWHPKDR